MIRLEKVAKSYSPGSGVTVQALRQIDLEIRPREYLGILGASGSGKSTLLYVMGLLDRPSAGRVLFDDRDTSLMGDEELSRLRGRSIGFVFQSFHLVPHLSVMENVGLPLFYQGVARGERNRRAAQVLIDVGLEPRGHHFPSELSGGERQRVAIGRALVTDPELILADEPTGNLDSKTGSGILDIFARLHGAGRTLAVITHDRAVAERIPRIVRIADGRIAEDGAR